MYVLHPQIQGKVAFRVALEVYEEGGERMKMTLCSVCLRNFVSFILLYLTLLIPVQRYLLRDRLDESLT